MGRIPDRKEAIDLLKQYNQESFHLRHAYIVSDVLRFYAAEYDPENIDFWDIVGLLHDLDFEQYPNEHCRKNQEIMRALGYDEELIRAIASHGYPVISDIEPQSTMEKILYATDELTGLIGATALMRPSRSLLDLETKSVMKKYKTPSFAAGCSREVISRGAEMLGWSLEDLIGRTILAMRGSASAEPEANP